MKTLKYIFSSVLSPLPTGEGLGVRLFVTLFFFSCTENKDLQLREVPDVPTTGRMVVIPQWGTGLQAEALRYDFYPTGSTSGKAISLEGTTAGCESDLPVGTYRVLAYNAGATGVRFAGTDRYETAAVELLPVATRTGGLTLVNEPPEVYAATVTEELTITAGGQTEGNAAVRNLTRTLVFDFTIGNGLVLNKLESTLCGVYPSVLLSTGEPTQTALQVAPDMAVRFDADFLSATEATATVRVPGLLDPQNGAAYSNVLALDLTTDSGEHWTSTVDLDGVLTQILADNGGTLPVEVPVELDIRIERTALGLSTTVAGWQTGEMSEGTIH
ncbi:DUF5119 domain-containing protein [Bacteroides sp.]